MSSPANPYEPPRAELAAREATQSPLAFAFTVFANHRLAVLLAAIWFPLNLGIEWFTQGDDPKNLMANFRLASLASVFVQPLCIGVVLEACRYEREGRASAFPKLLSGAKWGRVFAANFVANLIIALSALALVIPGLVLMVRYAFVEAAAAREDLSSGKARARSRELVAGRGWPIVGAYAAFLGVGAGPTIAFGVAAAFVPAFDYALDHFAVSAVFATALDLLHLLLFAVLSAMYDEAVAAQAAVPRIDPLVPQPVTAGAPS